MARTFDWREKARQSDVRLTTFLFIESKLKTFACKFDCHGPSGMKLKKKTWKKSLSSYRVFPSLFREKDEKLTSLMCCFYRDFRFMIIRARNNCAILNWIWKVTFCPCVLYPLAIHPWLGSDRCKKRMYSMLACVYSTPLFLAYVYYSPRLLDSIQNYCPCFLLNIRIHAWIKDVSQVPEQSNDLDGCWLIVLQKIGPFRRLLALYPNPHPNVVER